MLGRTRELETLDRLVHDVRDGQSRLRVVRAAGVEAESDFAYSALQQLRSVPSCS